MAVSVSYNASLNIISEVPFISTEALFQLLHQPPSLKPLASNLHSSSYIIYLSITFAPSILTGSLVYPMEVVKGTCTTNYNASEHFVFVLEFILVRFCGHLYRDDLPSGWGILTVRVNSIFQVKPTLCLVLRRVGRKPSRFGEGRKRRFHFFSKRLLLSKRLGGVCGQIKNHLLTQW